MTPSRRTWIICGLSAKRGSSCYLRLVDLLEQSVSIKLLQFQDAGQSSRLYANASVWKIHPGCSSSGRIYRWELKVVWSLPVLGLTAPVFVKYNGGEYSLDGVFICMLRSGHLSVWDLFEEWLQDLHRSQLSYHRTFAFTFFSPSLQHSWLNPSKISCSVTCSAHHLHQQVVH